MKDSEIDLSEEDELKIFEHPSDSNPDKKAVLKKVFKEEDLEAVIDCTYLSYGNQRVYTTIFYCLRCDELKIEPLCEACLHKCHMNCSIKNNYMRSQKVIANEKQKRLQRKSLVNDNIKSFVSQNSVVSHPKQVDYFICECGKNKHQKRKRQKMEISKCELEKDLGLDVFSYCLVCRRFLCELCVDYCHGGHETIKKVDTDNPSNDIERILRDRIIKHENKCDCTDGVHKTNSFVLDYYLQHMHALYENYPAKLFNTLILSINSFSHFFDFARNIILNNSDVKSDIFQILAGKSISAYLLSPGSSECVMKFSKHRKEDTFSIGDSENMKQFTDFLNTILRFIDEWDYSRFFYNGKIQEIIPYKKALTFAVMLLYHKNCETVDMYLMACKVINIVSHVHFKNDFHYMTCLKPRDYLSTSILERISFRKKILSEMDEKLKEKYFSHTKIADVITQITELLVTSFKEDFEVKYIETWNLSVIPMFIYYGVIYSVFEKTHIVKLINILNRFEELISSHGYSGLYYSRTINPFAILIKVAFMMAMTYNDITVEETLKEEGQGSLNVILNNERPKFLHENEETGEKFLRLIFKFNKLFKNQEVGTKYFILYQETLKLFGLCKNSYTDQIERMNLNLKQIQEYNSSKKQSSNKNNNNNSTNLLGKVFNELRSKIEGFVIPSEINLKISTFDNITFGFSEIFHMFTDEEIHGIFIKKSIAEKQISSHCEYKYHWQIFQFFQHHSAINLAHTVSLEDYLFDSSSLIATNIDILLCTYFRLDLLSPDHADLNTCLAVLSLYFLSKSSFKHICYGNKVSLIAKRLVNKGFCENSLHFLYIFTKGLEVYNIDLSRHKVIQVIKCLRSPKGELNYNSKIFILKIFKYLAGYFDFQYLGIIKMSLFNLFKNWFTSPEKMESFVYVLKKNKKLIAKSLKSKTKASMATFPGENPQVTVQVPDNIVEDQIDQVSVLDNSSIENGNENQQDENENEEQKLGDYKIFLALFDILSQNTFFTYQDDPVHRDMIKTIHIAMDISSIKKILSRTIPPLKDRSYILKFLRTFYFITRMNSNQWVKYEYLTSMQVYIGKEDKAQDKKDKKIASNLLKVMSIFIKELENLNQIVGHETKLEYIRQYLIELVFSVKRISDFVFNQKDIWSRFTWYLYKLAKRLIAQSKLIKGILESISIQKEQKEKVDINTLLEKYKTPVVIPVLESADFDIVDKRLIYQYITFFLNDIFAVTKINEKYTLSHALKHYDTEAFVDFNSVGVINNQKCFEEFYSQNDTQLEDLVSLKTKIKDRFLKSLSNFSSSIFFKVIDSTSFKKEENYSKHMIDFFICFMGEEFTSDLYRSETPEDNMFQNEQSVKAMLTLITKMLYFAPEKTQNSMDELLCPSKSEVNNEEQQPMILATANNNNQFLISHFKENFCKWKDKISEEEDHQSQKEAKRKEREADPNINQDPSWWLYDLITNSEARDKFFYSIFSKLQANFLQLYASSGNFLATKAFHQLALSNKALIQFLQLLSQRFKVSLLTLNINYTFPNKKSLSLFDLLGKHFERVLNMIDLDYCEKLETSQLKLIAVLNTLCDFFVEYIEACGSGSEMLFGNVMQLMKVLIKEERIHRFLLHWKKDVIQKDSELVESSSGIWEKTLQKVQVRIMEMIIAFIELRRYSDEEYMEFIVLLTSELPWMTIFEEVLSVFSKLVKRFEKIPKYETIMKRAYYYKAEYFLEIFTFVYRNEEEFENSLELTLCLNFFTYLKMMTVFYSCKNVDDFFEYHPELKTNTITKKTDYSTHSRSGLYSPHSYKVYRFLNHILLFVEVEISDKKNQSGEDTIIPIIFFKRPSITFFLSTRTKDQFLQNVDRDSHGKKQSALVKEFDYFLYEMMYNSTMDKRIQFLIKKIDFVYFEMFNYLLIIIHQAIFLATFYRSTSYDDMDYQISDIVKYQIPPGNKVVAYLQIAYISLVISFWFAFQFKLSLRQNLMSVLSIKFLTKRNAINEALISVDESKKLIDNINITPKALINNMKDDPSIWVKLKIGILQAFLYNKVINTFFYTLILLVIYLSTGNVIPLALSVLFIVNFNKTLRDIVLAIQLKWVQLISMLIFTYLSIYFFSWITFYFYYRIFEFDDAFDFTSSQSVSENYCRSAIQCYLTLIDQGFRNGGGIGEILPKISWKTSTGFYIARFAYVIIFHIFIILILGNIFFGIIVDAFKSLRERTDDFEEDKKNKCFVCNITREKSLNKNMNFDNHVNGVHLEWNYIYFMTYLILNDQSTFNVYEYRIREKISSGVNDNTWMPRDAGGDEEEK